MKASLLVKAVFVSVVGLLAWSWFVPPSNTDKSVAAFASFPVLENGRLKPIDTVARSYLMSFQGKQLLKLEHNPQEATAWLLTVLTDPEKAHKYPVFRIYHPGVKQLIGKSDADGKYFSFTDIRPFMPLLYEQAQKVQEIESPLRTPYDRAISQLFNQVDAYLRIQASFLYSGHANRVDELKRYQTLIDNGHFLLAGHMTSTTLSETEKTTLGDLLFLFKNFKQTEPLATIRIIPPQTQTTDLSEWQSLPSAHLIALKPQPLHIAVLTYAQLLDSYPTHKTEFLNTAQSYRSWLIKTYPKEMHKIDLEVRFNRFQPFYKSMLLYLVVFVLVMWVWLKGGKEHLGIYPLSTRLLFLAFTLHTLGIFIRMYLQGRPPITNLYTSAVFVGWVSVFLGMIFERHYKNGIGSVVATIIGFITLIIAHHLSLTGDTLEMMQAVLDSNFWLATHVVTINIGYGATIVAGILAHIYIFKRLLSKNLAQDQQKSIAKMVYGSACFAILFMVIGTVLGGVWADQSWGRFWGWDPKENGALMIVLWLAILLHARLGGFIKERGLMVMSVFSNIVTSFSWFGVNMLGVGLHSYGFMEKTFFWLMLFILIQCFVMWLAFVPIKNRK